MENNIILFLIDSFFEIKEFYQKNKDMTQRVAFLKEISTNFYNTFSDSNYLITDQKSIEHWEKNYSIFIKYKDTPFIFPHSYVRYFELEELHKTSYLDRINQYFLFVKEHQNVSLHLFLTSFFYYLQQINIKLSLLEYEVLKLLTDNNFMNYFYNNNDLDKKYRAYPPTYLEIYDALKDRELKCSRRSIQKIKSDLFTYQICYDRRILLNLAKIGFIYIFIEDMSEIPPKLVKFCLWEIQNGRYIDVILCIPFGNIDSLLEGYSYVILDSFHFNVDIKQYNVKKGWDNFEIPFNLLFTNEYQDNFQKINNWNIEPLQKSEVKIDNLDIEILDNLGRSNFSNYRAIDRLTQKITKNHIEKRLQKLASDGLFKFFSQVNFLGIDLSFRMKIFLENDYDMKMKILTVLSFFPEIMVFSNKDYIIAYLRIPRKVISSLLENINLFNLLYKHENKNIFLYSTDYYSIKNSVYVLDSIKLENGIAKIKDKN